jgi:hypothetical protein
VNYAILPRKHRLKEQRDGNDVVMHNLFKEVKSNSFERIGVRVAWVDGFGEIPGVINTICDAQVAG